MAANDIESLIKEKFPEGDFAEHLEYLKAAYSKQKKRAKLFDSVREKVVTGSVMALLIFAGNAILTEVKRFLSN